MRFKGKLWYGLLILSVVGVAILVDVVEPPLWWQYEAQNNKRVIMEYANCMYPEAKVVRQIYRSTYFNPTNAPYDSIVFNLEGIEFAIDARHGQLGYDGYQTAKASKYIKDKYLNAFFEPRKFVPLFEILADGIIDDANNYYGSAAITFRLFAEKEQSTPNDLEWLYEFYSYFDRNCKISGGYTIQIYYYINNTSYYYCCYSDDSFFANSTDFYDEFSFSQY